jgi:hypothetical protein
MKDPLRSKWRNHKWGAIERGLNFLTYEQYVEKLAEAGITYKQVSRKKGGYCLARYTDQGDYTPQSCRFVPLHVNVEDRTKNGGTEAMRQKAIGRTKYTHEGNASQSEKMRGRTAETHPYIAEAIKKRVEVMRGRTRYNHAGLAARVEKLSCDFAFFDPNGNLHMGRGLNDFCREKGLHCASMSKLRTGKLKSYHGWTLAQGDADDDQNSAAE